MKTLLWVVGICAALAQPAWPQERGYLKLRRDYTDEKNKVKFFKEEIYGCERPKASTPWTIRYGNLKIELPNIDNNRVYDLLEKTRAEAMSGKEKDLKNKLDGLIKKQIISGQTKYLFNVKAIKKSGQIVIFASNQTPALTFDSKEIDSIKDLNGTFPDEYIRVIVPEAPTLFIEKAGIHEPEPEYGFDPEKYSECIGKDGKIYLQQEDGKIFLTDKKYVSMQEIMNQKIVLTSGQILMVDGRGLGAIIDTDHASPFWDAIKNTSYVVIGVAVIIFLFLYLNKKKSSGSTRRGEPSAVPSRQTSGFHRFLQSIFPQARSSTRDKVLLQRLNQTGSPATPPSVGAPGELGLDDGNILEQRFKVIEASLVNAVSKEIKRLATNKNEEMQAENDRLLGQVTTLKQSLSAAALEKEAVRKELFRKETELNDTKLELDDKKKQLTEYGQAARTIEELKQYVYPLLKTETLVQQHLMFFSSLQGIESKVQSLLTRSLQENPAGADADHLMMMWSKYAVKKNGIPIVRWELLLNGMKEKGVLTDRELIRRLKGEKNDEQRWRVLTELLHKEVYLRWLSAILVLMEEVRNLEHFTGGAPTRVAEEARNFEREIRTLRAQAQQLFEITAYYAPLFDDYAQHSNIRAVDEPVYLFYRTLRLQRDCIHQIVSYGLKSPYGNEPTTVILAK